MVFPNLFKSSRLIIFTVIVYFSTLTQSSFTSHGLKILSWPYVLMSGDHNFKCV